MNELDELYERKYSIEERMGNFFGGDSNPNYGDRGYQDLWEQLTEVEDEIKSREIS